MVARAGRPLYVNIFGHLNMLQLQPVNVSRVSFFPKVLQHHPLMDSLIFNIFPLKLPPKIDNPHHDGF